MTGNGIVNAAGVVFASGYLFATKSGGVTDDVPFGKLSDITLKDVYSLKELPGPESLGAVAIGASDAKVTLTAKYAQIDARQWNMARGSTITYDGGTQKTTITRGVNDQPLPFTAHFLTPSDGADVEVIFYDCIAPDLGVDFKLHDFAMNDITINVYGDGTKFYEFIVAGDQTG